MEQEKVFPGTHTSAQVNITKFFGKKEKEIVKYWAREWYITNAGKRMLQSNSEYLFFLAKPTDSIAKALDIAREVVVIISTFDSFEPRSLEAYDALVSEFMEQRYEKMCYALISADCEIERKLQECLTNNEKQIIVPFSYDLLNENKNNPHFLRNQFRKFFYSCDLFDFSGPLKKGTFFFGRTDIVSRVIGSHKNDSNFGLFGLRKTGKTSIICDIERKSNSQEFIAVTIDCQDTSFNMRRWNKALYYVIEKCAKIINYTKDISEDEFTLENASTQFGKYMIEFNKCSNRSFLLMFDEIENISFGKSSSSHWCNELDFVYFWQSIRSNQQTQSGIFSFCIVGTNPKCVEDATILGKDNPIFCSFQPYYIPGFDYAITREMVRSMGRIMGIKFDETIFSRMFEDYGGHPFLIRRVCSQIAQMNPNRPVQIDRSKYIEAKNKFNLENNYFEMMLDVLIKFYSDEYEMLKFLAVGDYDNFYYFVKEDPSMISHLLGYGIIKECDGKYDFKLDSIKDYLVRKNSDHIVIESNEEKWSYVCKKRNNIEIELRKIVRQVVRFAHKNESEAKTYIVKKIYANDRRYLSKSYNDLFDSRNSNIYLKNLTTLILADWDYFSDYFGKQDIFIANMNVINTEGRFDAHATVPNDNEIKTVANSVDAIEQSIDKYHKAMG